MKLSRHGDERPQVAYHNDSFKEVEALRIAYSIRSQFGTLAVVALIAIEPAHGATVPVGPTSIILPCPSGFAELTPAMGALFEAEKLSVVPTNERLASFIPEGSVPAALKSETPEITRKLTAQTPKNMLNVAVSRSDFAEVKRLLRSQNDEILRSVEAKMPGFIEKANAGGLAQEGIAIEASSFTMIPLPVHEETENSISYSMFVRGALKADSKIVSVTPGTVTFLVAKGKVIFLYAFGDENDLEWTRTASRQWAQAVLSSNPPDAAVSGSSSSASPTYKPSGSATSRITERAVLGALIGLLFGGAGWAIRRIRNSGDRRPGL